MGIKLFFWMSPIILFSYLGKVDSRRTLKLGFITPNSGPLSYGTTAAATTMAIEKAKKDGYLPDTDVRLIWRNGACSGKQALGVTVTLWREEDVDGYIGLPCSIAAINAGKVISFWNLPHFTHESPDPELAHKQTYTTLIRMLSPFNKLALALLKFIENMGWSRVAMVTTSPALTHCDFASRSIEKLFLDSNITLIDWLKRSSMPDRFTIFKWLDRIKERARIIIICTDEVHLRDFMLQAEEKKMTDGDYVFIEPTLLPYENYKNRWQQKDGNDERAFTAFQTLLQMALGFVNTEEAEKFREELPKKMAEPPWNYTKTLENKEKGSLFSLYLHDTLYLYCIAVDRVLKLGGDPRNGTFIFDQAKNITFKGISGDVVLDEIGDRIGDYWIWQLRKKRDEYDLWAKISVSKKDKSKVIEYEAIRHWGAKFGYEIPLDTPKCGFFNELCPKEGSGLNIATVIAIVASIVLIGAGSAVVYVFYRRKKFENEIDLMLWKIKYEDVHFPSKSLGSIRTLGQMSASAGSETNSINTLNNYNRTSSIKVGNYKGTLAKVTYLRSETIVLSRYDHIELKNMRELNHDNVNPFIGACIDAPNICYLTKYCSKGSLEDVISNENIKLDSMFKSSLTFDLINGLDYIHHSSLKSHGTLKSSNCLIDGRWILKISDYGLSWFKKVPENEFDIYKDQLWTAPEILRMIPMPIKGTQKGDIYSFAIILQELYYGCSPFRSNCDSIQVPKDLVGRVRNGETPPFRPICPHDPKIDVNIINLIKDCWSEEPASRPDTLLLKNRFNLLNKGKQHNIMDNMLRMMEKYATNLEGLVEQRTKELVEEKKKTDLLLYRMLPSTVADNLKMGVVVQPELFKEVSVYFSDIVSFTKMCSESTPLEVETIGDAYMCASGIPVPIGIKHASEIAVMALHILKGVREFTIKHKPQEQLKIRIGIHSGPVVAGVIGLTMPRYCLFGDTVNTASRMESTGEAQKIHLSHEAYLAIQSSSSSFEFSRRGETEIKGKGLVTTFWLDGNNEAHKIAGKRNEYL
ncbi:DgyrCDS3138 [Dimorphilus gyrociliatus]|uniref:Guanylate cyclase n=1 Tax=Dimorphilus gyrociliatus TaxID=2664684 RepID=A0A7I8VE67_9ANNE|nr:DgyrCDS3138 [Dimorphilus gyrociliatus]